MQTPRTSNYVYVPTTPPTPTPLGSGGDRSKSWCFTLNNYSSSAELDIQILARQDPSIYYLIYGREIGDSGTPHLQGFVRFKTKRTFGVVQSLLPWGTHLEKRVKGSTDHQAADYCKKEDKNPFEFVNLA